MSSWQLYFGPTDKDVLTYVNGWGLEDRLEQNPNRNCLFI